MKGMKGRILRKLRSIPHVTYLKQGRVLHVNAADGLVVDDDDADAATTSPESGRAILSDLPLSSCREAEILQQPEIIDVSELMRDLLDDEDQEASPGADKENTRPASPPPPLLPPPRKKNPKETYRRPDLNSETLFDPALLSAFEQAVADHIDEARHRPSKVPRTDGEGEEEEFADSDSDPLSEFEERCPPGGSGSAILYTTTLRGIRKTFEDCNSVRLLLENLRVAFCERDVSMHAEFREELRRLLSPSAAIPPKLFVRGRYVGGADRVLGLHEQGRLRPLLRGLPLRRAGGAPCGGCAGVRFVVCSQCSGGRKLYAGDWSSTPVQCRQCNENGLAVCPICC